MVNIAYRQTGRGYVLWSKLLIPQPFSFLGGKVIVTVVGFFVWIEISNSHSVKHLAPYDFIDFGI